MSIKTTVDAVRSLNKVVENSSAEFSNIILFLNQYDLFEKVFIALEKNSVINGGVINLDLQDASGLYQKDEILNDTFWGNYFLKKEDAFSSSVNVNVKPVDDDNSFFVKEHMDQISVVVDSNEHVIEFSNLKVADLTFDDIIHNNTGVVIPVSLIETIIPRIGEHILLDVSQTRGKIFFNDVTLLEINYNNLRLKAFDFSNTILKSANLNSPKGKIDINQASEVYLTKGEAIHNTSLVPKDAKHNITLLSDVLKSGYIVPGSAVDFILTKEPDFKNDLEPAIDDHIKNNQSDMEIADNYLVTQSNYKEVISKMLSQYATM